MIKVVLFDLDNTLLNRDKSVLHFVESQYERLYQYIGHIPKEKYITRFIELDDRGYVWKDIVYQRLTEEFLINGITWQELLQDYVINFKFSCIPFEDLENMLGELKENNLTLGIITNGYGQFQMDNIKYLGIVKYFETILISEWEGIKKPNPLIFKRAARRLGVIPNQCLFVGDHPENDVKAAKNVGMKSIWKRDEQLLEVEADFIIGNLLEIPLIIEQINN
ncbi:HAD family hydrolase [Pseudogracilibacillus sp. SE30717A]|uniref:HAD family hydrolase n=1 Tax=Pseudogracilibacillus sp. SE30717A TaxID=3098293 RepID=UPI00300E64A0